MIKAFSVTSIIIVAFSLQISTAARAEGLFDFLDSCIGQKSDYWSYRDTVTAEVNSEIEGNTSASPTDKFKELWWTEKRQLLRKYFDENIAPSLSALGITEAKQLDAAFETFLAKQTTDSGGEAGVNAIIAKEYQRIRLIALKKDQGATIAELDKQKSDLYGSCPSDVGNQVVRGSMLVLTAPIGLVTRNIEISKQESGALAKVIAAGTGISVSAIAKHGPLGGSGSEARKACDGIAKTLFGGSKSC